MNREQRRHMKKNTGSKPTQKTNAPLAPLSPDTLIAKYPELSETLNKFAKKCNMDGRNELFNTLLGCILISLHDKYDFTADMLNTLTSQALEQMECIRLGFVSEADIVNAVSELGVLVEDMDYSKVVHNAEQAKERLKAYEEVMEQVKKTEQLVRAEKMKKMINDGMAPKDIAEKLGVKSQAVYDFKNSMKKKELVGMSIDEFADELYSEDMLNSDNIEPQQAEQPKTLELHTENEKCNTEPNRGIVEGVEEITAEQAVQELNEVVNQVVNQIEENTKEENKMGLRKITKVIRLEGDMATYEKTAEGAIAVETNEGQTIILTKEQMFRLGEEFLLVVKEEF